MFFIRLAQKSHYRCIHMQEPVRAESRNLKVGLGLSYALRIMPVEQSGRVYCWDDDPFQRSQQYWWSGRSSIPEDFGLLGLWLFEVCHAAGRIGASWKARATNDPQPLQRIRV